MSEVLFSMELEAGADADTVAEELIARLSELEAVEAVDAQANSERFGMVEATTVVAGVVGLITIVGNATTGLTTVVANLRKLVTELQGLMGDLGITKAAITVEGKPILIDAVTDTDLEKLASASAEGKS